MQPKNSPAQLIYDGLENQQRTGGTNDSQRLTGEQSIHSAADRSRKQHLHRSLSARK